MKRLPLDEDIAPIRERRIGGVRAYHGSALKLLEEAKSGRMQNYDRAFSGSWSCSFLYSGVIRIMNAPDIVAVIHSPVGCVTHVTSFQSALISSTWESPDLVGYKPRQAANWYCTNLTQEDVIFGGESKLRETILTIDRMQHPKSIWVFTSCSSGIMGDDIEGIVQEIQPKVEAVIVPIHCESFRSRILNWGADATAQAVMKYVVREPKQKQENLVNMFASQNVATEDRLYLQSLLGKMGIKVNSVPVYVNFESFQMLSEAAASLAIDTTYGDYFIKALKQQYGVPYVRNPVPFGIAKTEEWLRKVAHLLGKEKEAEAVIKEERAVVEPEIKALREKLEGIRVFVCNEQGKAYYLPHMLVGDFGMELAGINPFEFDEECVESLEELLQLTGGKDFLVNVADNQVLEMVNYIKKLNVDLFLGMRNTNIYMMKHGIQTANVRGEFHGLRKDLSLTRGKGQTMGFKGVVAYGDYLVKVMSNPSVTKKLSAHLKLPFKESWYSKDPATNIVKPVHLEK